MFYKRYEVFAEYFHPLGLIQSPLGLVTADSFNTELKSSLVQNLKKLNDELHFRGPVWNFGLCHLTCTSF